MGPALSGPEAAAFIGANTVPGRAPLVPEFALYLASEITPIWQASEAVLRQAQMAPPFWAFAWPGGQALARYILDHPACVAGRTVLDFAAGGGIAALAAARAGAACVQAAEIDPLAIAAIGLNARLNDITIAILAEDVVGACLAWDVILCGDVCYEAPMTRHILPWLRNMAREGAQVWIADPGRAYLPTDAMVEIAAYDVPTTLELEDSTLRRTKIFSLTQAKT